MKTVTTEIGGVVWHLRELTLRQRLNAEGALAIGGMGDFAFQAVAAGIESAEGVDIPKVAEMRSRALWIETYFASRPAELMAIAQAIVDMSKVGDEGKGPSESQPTSSAAP